MAPKNRIEPDPGFVTFRDHLRECDERFGEGQTSKAKSLWAGFTEQERYTIVDSIDEIRDLEQAAAPRNYNYYYGQTFDQVSTAADEIGHALRTYEMFLHNALNVIHFPATSLAFARNGRQRWLDAQRSAHAALHTHEVRRRVRRKEIVVTTDELFHPIEDRYDREHPALPTLPGRVLHEQGWHARAFNLGEGGQGTADLLVRVDGNGRIIDRKVVKRTILSRLELLSAADWFPDVYDVMNRRPMEVESMECLGRRETEGAVILTHWTLDSGGLNTRQRLTLYCEFCEYGDLHDLVVSHSAAHPILQGAYATHGLPRDHLVPAFLPEPFVWHLFESLLEVASSMENALPEPRIGAHARDIVHRDLKLGNIFMAARNPSGRYPSYPMIKIGDFGSSVATAATDAFNPYFYNMLGTDGYIAPEQGTWFLDNNDHDRIYPSPKLSSATNVWQIAKVMMDVMNHPHDPLPSDRGDTIAQPYFARPGSLPVFRDHAFFYGDNLRSLVLRCLEREPTDRPSISEIQEEILGNTETTDQVQPFSGMRDTQPEDAPWQHVLELSDVKFRLTAPIPSH